MATLWSRINSWTIVHGRRHLFRRAQPWHCWNIERRTEQLTLICKCKLARWNDPVIKYNSLLETTRKLNIEILLRDLYRIYQPTSSTIIPTTTTVHYVRKSYRYFKKSCSNHVLISHFRPYWLVRHHLWTINPQCKFEEIFWNHQKYTIFDENSCLALPECSYIVQFSKICLATGSTG